MPSEILKLTSEIAVSHASMFELTPELPVGEIKEVYNVLSSLDGGATLEDPAETVMKPPIPLKDIVKVKYVVCLECGKRLKALKTHLRKGHGLTTQEYYARYGLNPKQFSLVCKDYSEARRQMAKDRGFGVKGARPKVTT
jgi:predicted transcriptional regulator